MSGEGSGVTGTSYTLTCRVSLPSGVEPDSLDIQWLGLPTPQPVMISTGVYISNVTLNPLLPNNTGYTCTASYTINGVSSLLVQKSTRISTTGKLSNILSFFYTSDSLLDAGDVSVYLTGSKSRIVGSSFTLTCAVTLSNRVIDSSVSILWQGPSTDEEITDTTDMVVIVNEISLDPLKLAHGGNYTCTAYYTVHGETFTSSDNEAVIPISECQIINW